MEDEHIGKKFILKKDIAPMRDRRVPEWVVREVKCCKVCNCLLNLYAN
jgi:hypothetical protein